MPAVFCFVCYNSLRKISKDGNLLPDIPSSSTKHPTVTATWDKSNDFVTLLSEHFMNEFGKKYSGKEKETTPSETTLLGHQVVKLVPKGTVKKCAVCETIETTASKLLTCGRCHGESYCSKVCQKAAWKNHKPTCRVQVSSETTLTESS